MSAAMDVVLPASVPRAYQHEIFAQACERNIIAVMGTGTGKTLVAISLIRWMAERLVEPGTPRQLSVFLVPSVPLVFQQTRAIQAETALTVRSYCGEMGVDFWDRDKWLAELDLEHTHCLVMTAQIFYNILAHAYISIEQVNLIVMDEVHHCRKRHPYNVILEEFYHRLPEGRPRPKILGLTASPIYSLKDPLGSLRTLEQNTQSKVVAVKANDAELQAHANKPVEEIVWYQSDPYVEPTRLFEAVAALDFEQVGKVKWEKVAQKADSSLRVLGSRAMDDFVVSQLSHPVDVEMQASELLCIRKPAPHVVALKQLFEDVKRDPSTLTEDQISDKVLRLATVLESHRQASRASGGPAIRFQAIIFVQQRHLAMGLADLLPQVPALSSWVKCRSLLGHGGQGWAEGIQSGQLFKEQEKIVSEFRQGTFNILVATSVAEEGLDFPACDLVVRFDPLLTIIGYVQSRGRARMKESRYVVMIDETSPDERRKYATFRDAEGHMANVYKQERGPVKEFDEEDNELNPLDRERRERFTVESTGATLTYGEAVSLVNQTCALLPDNHGQQVATYAESPFEMEFFVTLQLPAIISLPRSQLRIVGPSRCTKAEAKRAAAFACCLMLHAHGLLNEYLLPHREEVPTHLEKDNASNGSADDLPDEIEVHRPSPFGTQILSDSNTPLYLHKIRLNGLPRLGVISSKPLTVDDPFQLFQGAIDDEATIEASVSPPILLDTAANDGDIRARLNAFTRQLLQTCIRPGRVWNEDLACYFALLDSNGEVDLTGMERLLQHRPAEATTISHDKVSIDTFTGQHVAFEQVRRDISPSSRPVPVEQAIGQPTSCREELFDSYIAYAEHVNRNRWPRQPLQLSPDTLMCQVRSLHKRRHNLAAAKRINQGIKGADGAAFVRYIVPITALSELDLTLSSRSEMLLLPSILRHICDTIRITTTETHLDLSSISPQLRHQALTPPAAQYGYDYQRLETLGDNVLKLCTTIWLYDTYQLKHEGTLTKWKDRIVSNRNLRQKGWSAGLGRLICSDLVRVRRWSPPLISDTATKIKRRWLQDSTEALLGAAYLSNGLACFLKLAREFGLECGNLTVWNHTRADASGDLPARINVLAKLEDGLGYRFRTQALLVEALTHPSFPNPQTRPYDRLEFLGDAVLDFYIMGHLYRLYPSAPPSQLTIYRHHLACNTSFGFIAVKALQLNLYALRQPLEGDRAYLEAAQTLSGLTWQAILPEVWVHNPPKIFNDLFEAVIGAVCVDSGYNMEVCDRVIEPFFRDAFASLHLIPLGNPVQKLVVWAMQTWHCQGITFSRQVATLDNQSYTTSRALFHGHEIGSGTDPVRHSSMCQAAKAGLQALQDDMSLRRLCVCSTTGSDSMEVDNHVLGDTSGDTSDDEESNTKIN